MQSVPEGLFDLSSGLYTDAIALVEASYAQFREAVFAGVPIEEALFMDYPLSDWRDVDPADAQWVSDRINGDLLERETAGAIATAKARRL